MTQPKALIVVSEDWYFLSHRLPLAQKLKSNGFDVRVICKITHDRKKIEGEGFSLIPLELDRENFTPLKALKTVLSLRNIYQKEQADLIIHVALLTSFLGTFASWFCKSTKILNMITGFGFLFISQSSKVRVIRNIIKTFFRLFSLSSNTHIIVQNQDDQKIMAALGFKVGKTLHLIKGSGVDAEKFHPAPQFPKRPVATFVGRLLWAKGVDEIVKAARLLKDKGRDYKIVLVGDIDPGNPQSATQEHLNNWKKEGIVEFWGAQSNITEIYQKSTIALLPSWREGLPKSLLEAAACGIPMIATDVPGCREIVKHNENGYLVGLKNPIDLANAIEKLMENPELCQKFGQAARRDIDAELNDQAILEKTALLIKNILKN
ncbi:Group 1 glycosyl transferase [Candidatus Terasakiella magnetica]|uniref:Group 1 glycosyl transferase n=1 Tax=Candidatus Terasakiella magnetica TaxID=1867952 RepID=A0A1C3RG28_9PROT|nr:glycosyltransferase family 4 protein [Candidatus Terasakiella magnetica]SCA56205.1 Group 1 glycosyl transferase [Candidatus Terasakiella magnetica]